MRKYSARKAFGTLLVVPKGQTLGTSYTYQLPQMVVSRHADGKQFNYSLKIQKQPGTQDIPLTFHVVLPPGMIVMKPTTWTSTVAGRMGFTNKFK